MADLLGIEIALALGLGLLVLAIVGGGITYEVVKHKEEIEGVVEEVEGVVETGMTVGRYVLEGGEIVWQTERELYGVQISAAQAIASDAIAVANFTEHVWLASQDQGDPGYAFELEKKATEENLLTQWREFVGIGDAEREAELRVNAIRRLEADMKANEERIAKAVERKRQEDDLEKKRQENAERYERQMVQDGVFGNGDRRVQGLGS